MCRGLAQSNRAAVATDHSEHKSPDRIPTTFRLIGISQFQGGMDMELEKFDDLTRTFSGASTRRRFGGLLTALGLGTVAGLGLLGAADTDAKKRHKKRH